MLGSGYEYGYRVWQFDQNVFSVKFPIRVAVPIMIATVIKYYTFIFGEYTSKMW